MPMALPLVPSPVLRAARPHKVLLTVPDLALALVTLPVLDRGTKPGLAAAAVAAARAQVPATLPALVPAVAEAAPVAVINPAPVLVTRTALVPEISPAAVGTKSQFGGE